MSLEFSSYKDPSILQEIVQLIQKDLSEPYCLFTYRYFIEQWPHLCFLCTDENKLVGCIIGKLERHKSGTYRGYLAMLAVDKEYRKKGIGIQLSNLLIDTMKSLNADEIVLETELTNIAALKLYEKLGFVRDKRLHRYYLNGVDAFRLKYFIQPPHQPRKLIDEPELLFSD